MGTWHVGVIDCVEQIRLANAEAVREAWTCAFIIGLMIVVLCAAVWAIYRMVSKKMLTLSTTVVLTLFALGATKKGGTKVVTERGINLTKCEVDAHNVVLEWNTSDERILPGSKFIVQVLREGGLGFETVSETTASNAVIPRFTLDKTHTWRIAVDVGEVHSDEGGTE